MSKKKKEEVEINMESEAQAEEALQELAHEIEASEEGETGDETEALQAKVEEFNQKYIRLYADFDNYRKRVVKEKEDLMKYAPEPLVFDLLTVIDTLELALSHANVDDSSDSLKKGIEMTLKEFFRVLEKSGLKQVEALGKRFDPEFHEAMTQVIRDDVEDGVVIEEFRKGYLFHEKLLRPSLVAVSKSGEASSVNEDNGDSEENNEMNENNSMKEEDENE